MHSDGYFTSLLRLWSAHASGLLHFSSVRHHIPACGGYHGKRLVLMLAIIEKGGVQPLPFSCDKLLRQNPFKIVSSAFAVRLGAWNVKNWPPEILPMGRKTSCDLSCAAERETARLLFSCSLSNNCNADTRLPLAFSAELWYADAERQYRKGCPEQ